MIFDFSIHSRHFLPSDTSYAGGFSTKMGMFRSQAFWIGDKRIGVVLLSPPHLIQYQKIHLTNL